MCNDQNRYKSKTLTIMKATIWKFNNTLLNIHWFKQEITTELEYIFELYGNLNNLSYNLRKL